MGWNDINLGEAQRRIEDVGRAVGNAVDGLVDNTVGDIGYILGQAGDCLQNLDNIRVRVMNRAAEYHTAIMRIIVDAGIIPADLIEAVWELISGDLAADPNPRLFKIIEPEKLVYSGTSVKETDFKEVNPNDPLEVGRRPYVFIHGKNYGSGCLEAFEFYKDFEKNIQWFKNGKDYSNVDFYLVSYDTRMTDENMTLIRKAISAITGGLVTGTGMLFFWAVMWRELERRAQITGDYILPLLQKMNDADVYGRIISHSLGCFTAAHMSSRYIDERRGDRPPVFNWLCLAPAIPANAFTNTGMFENAPRVAVGPDGPGYGTSVFYSYGDLVLFGLYGLLANYHTAMGNIGALESKHPLNNIDVTHLVRDAHLGYDYWSRIKPELHPL
ncbi:hypothetical protein [Bacillus cereus]|uniref:hypothetical protein n=1 Tax=Bacillus cereus TaxID=1396 RepID=UPI000BF30A3D|nr:hypothetical protein [Bacillus cereus]PFU19512.1 hypothetical protein COK76_30840 [Bacillus cereus]PGP57641.1 hypothetical protein COA04_29535 [Bacillus cereus]